MDFMVGVLFYLLLLYSMYEPGKILYLLLYNIFYSIMDQNGIHFIHYRL